MGDSRSFVVWVRLYAYKKDLQPPCAPDNYSVKWMAGRGYRGVKEKGSRGGLPFVLRFQNPL